MVFAPPAPTEYNGALNTKLEGGTAGDLITCRPFDASLELFKKGYLASLNDLPGMENFSDVAKSAWITDDGKDVFCVPMASVIHGFIYNKDIFDKLGLHGAQDRGGVLRRPRQDQGRRHLHPAGHGHHRPVGSRHHGLPEHRPQLLEGRGRPQGADQGHGEVHRPAVRRDLCEQLAKWAPYLADGYQAQTYPDSQNLFTLGKAAIYPDRLVGDLRLRDADADFKMGAFTPPVPEGGDKCYITDHTDIAMGMNAKTKNPEAAKKFLEWMTTPEFAELYANALPGFFTLSNAKINVKDPLAQTFVSWRGNCKSTIRNSYQILSRGTPNLENELWRVSAAGHQRQHDARSRPPSRSRTAWTSGTSRRSKSRLRASVRGAVALPGDLFDRIGAPAARHLVAAGLIGHRLCLENSSCKQPPGAHHAVARRSRSISWSFWPRQPQSTRSS